MGYRVTLGCIGRFRRRARLGSSIHPSPAVRFLRTSWRKPFEYATREVQEGPLSVRQWPAAGSPNADRRGRQKRPCRLEARRRSRSRTRREGRRLMNRQAAANASSPILAGSQHSACSASITFFSRQLEPSVRGLASGSWFFCLLLSFSFYFQKSFSQSNVSDWIWGAPIFRVALAVTDGLGNSRWRGPSNDCVPPGPDNF